MDNTYRSSGELSREAEEIVDLIKEDYLISRFSVLPPLLEENSSENNRESYRAAERSSRHGGSPASNYNQSVNWIVSPQAQVTTSIDNKDSFTDDNDNMTQGIMSYSQQPISNMIAAMNQPMTQPLDQAYSQGLINSRNNMGSSSSASNMPSMGSLESSDMQVQISSMNQLTYGHQPSNESMKTLEQSSQNEYECMINSITSQANNSGFDTGMMKQDSCQMANNSSETSQSTSSIGSYAPLKMYQTPEKSVRCRSVSTPHMHPKAQLQSSASQVQTQQVANTSMTSSSVQHASQTRKTMERSNSLPVFVHRRNAIGPALNAQILQQSQHNLASLRCPFPSDSSYDSNIQQTGSSSSANSNHSSPSMSSSHDISSYTSKRYPSGYLLPEQPSMIAQLLSNNPTVSSMINNSSGLNNGLSIGNSMNTKSASLSSLNTFDKNNGSSPEQPYQFHGNTSNMNLGFSFGTNRTLSNSAANVDSIHHHHQQQQTLRQPSNSIAPGIMTDSSPTRTSLGSPTSSHQPLFSNNAGGGKPVRKISSTLSPTGLGPFFPSSKDSGTETPVASSLGPPAMFLHKPSQTKTESEKINYREHRRVSHINAEQKRRCNIKNGFDTLRTLLPSVSQNSSTKISKAAMLQKAAEHIRQMKQERQQYKEESEKLRKQIEGLNHAIGQLPATGVPITCQHVSQKRERFDAYIRERTSRDWKFHIFGLLMESLLESYMTAVTTNDFDDMCHSIIRWMEQNCSLQTLRREALNALRNLSTTTNILSNPDKISEEILEIVSKKFSRLNYSHNEYE
ncbi:MLX interacting protein mondo isoform X2 [Brevipalpus obovatus]|uniref:MLX interacting protein mondo isoform X2 n=1 Tax=Brevipalpus obovatus TaxID=246614 RepID=UPI003D9F5B1C